MRACFVDSGPMKDSARPSSIARIRSAISASRAEVSPGCPCSASAAASAARQTSRQAWTRQDSSWVRSGDRGGLGLRAQIRRMDSRGDAETRRSEGGWGGFWKLRLLFGNAEGKALTRRHGDAEVEGDFENCGRDEVPLVPISIFWTPWSCKG